MKTCKLLAVLFPKMSKDVKGFLPPPLNMKPSQSGTTNHLLMALMVMLDMLDIKIAVPSLDFWLYVFFFFFFLGGGVSVIVAKVWSGA